MKNVTDHLIQINLDSVADEGKDIRAQLLERSPLPGLKPKQSERSIFFQQTYKSIHNLNVIMFCCKDTFFK